MNKPSKQKTVYKVLAKAKRLRTADLFTTNWQATLTNISLRLLNSENVTQLSLIDANVIVAVGP